MKGLLDDPIPPTSNKSFVKSLLKFGVFSLIAYNCFNYSLNSYLYESEIQTKVDALINQPQLAPVRPSNFQTDQNSLNEILKDEAFRNVSIEKFSNAIKIETESYDDNPDPKDDVTPWLKFYKFHDYLKESFPLVHESLKLEKPNKVSLLYTWEGSNKDLKPLFLTAHQDVVPVDPLAAKSWTFPPYSGHFDGENIWGRGSVDCKNLLVGILEAIEKLIQDGFKPDRTVILGFGSDEESSGFFGASYINDTLYERYGPDSFYALVDEGSSIAKLGDQWFALPGTTEKGHIDIVTSLTTPGGHSSIPPPHTNIGIVSELITLFEANPFESILTPRNPILQFYQALAKADSNLLPKDIKEDIFRAEFDPKANKRLRDFIVQNHDQQYLIQTSQAIDVINGGVKSNALPEFTQFTYNSRIAVEQTVEDVIDNFLHYVKQVANKHSLGLSLEDEILLESTPNGFFNVTIDGGINALPTAPPKGSAWETFAGTIKHLYEDVIFQNNETITVSPFMMTGNTDTKRYVDFTDNIYRFMAISYAHGDSFKGIHTVDEKIKIDQHLETIAFIYEFILNANEAKDE